MNASCEYNFFPLFPIITKPTEESINTYNTLVNKIFGYLDYDDLKNCALVNCDWKVLSDERITTLSKNVMNKILANVSDFEASDSDEEVEMPSDSEEEVYIPSDSDEEIVEMPSDSEEEIEVPVEE